jgi:hypothetical protein
VVERSRLPGGRGVALHAGLRIALRLMIRIGCAGIVRPMAVHTIHRESGKFTAGMAILAQHRFVCAGQWELRVVVRKRCRSPVRRRMTSHAVRFELRCYMVRRRCRTICGLVTTVTLLRGVLEDTVHVTRRTRRGNVRTRERKCCAAVVKVRTPAEGIHLVTFLAIRTETGKGVTGFLGALIVRTVATKTCDRSPRVFVLGSLVVAILAVQRCMSAKQGESRVLMPLDHVIDAPRLHRMAASAIRSHFRLVHIGVAGCTKAARSCKLQTFVTANALDACVLPLKRKSCLRMLEGSVHPHLP